MSDVDIYILVIKVCSVIIITFIGTEYFENLVTKRR